jgi:hypothetical protein
MKRKKQGETADRVGGAVVEWGAALAGFPIPGLGILGERFTSHLREEWTRKSSIALEAAERAAELTREELGEVIANHPRLVPLATRLLYAAAMNGHEDTLRAMGSAFGDAVRDPDGIDESELILTALADLTEDHARTLLLLSAEPPEREDSARVWTAATLAEESKIPPRSAILCLGALLARGLVDAGSGFGRREPSYEITEPGKQVLQALREYANADDGCASA